VTDPAARPDAVPRMADWMCSYLLGHVNAPGWAGRGPSPCALRAGHDGDHKPAYRLAEREAATQPEPAATALASEGFTGHKPLPDGRCEHRWRNRQTKVVTCRFADGWHAGQVALAAAGWKRAATPSELAAEFQASEAQRLHRKHITPSELDPERLARALRATHANGGTGTFEQYAAEIIEEYGAAAEDER
jgi:hypothetical protein